MYESLCFKQYTSRNNNNICIYVLFFFQHPGGPELIDEYAGKDATKAYDEAGHSSDANSELKKHKIGELAHVCT